VAKTSPTARAKIGRKFERKFSHGKFQAAEKSRGGRKIKNTTSGSSRTSGSPGNKPIKSPAMTSRIGKGNLTRSATTVRMLMIPRRVRRVWIFSIIRPLRMSGVQRPRSIPTRASFLKALAQHPGAMH
jgi:hypothetical protein